MKQGIQEKLAAPEQDEKHKIARSIFMRMSSVDYRKFPYSSGLRSCIGLIGFLPWQGVLNRVPQPSPNRGFALPELRSGKRSIGSKQPLSRRNVWYLA